LSHSVVSEDSGLLRCEAKSVTGSQLSCGTVLALRRRHFFHSRSWKPLTQRHSVISNNHSPRDTASYPTTTHPETQRHIPQPLTQRHSVISHNHLPTDTASYPRTTHPETQRHIPELLTQIHNVTSQNYSLRDTASYLRTTHPET